VPDRFARLQQGQVGAELFGGLIALGGVFGAGFEHDFVELEHLWCIGPGA